MSTAQDQIDLLEQYWTTGLGVTLTGPTYTDVVDAMKSLVHTATYDTTTRLLFSSQGVFMQALSQEVQSESDIQLNIKEINDRLLYSSQSNDYNQGGPRYYMLAALKEAILGGYFTTPDPTGLASWIGLIDPAGQAVSKALSSDPEVVVRGALLDLLKSVNWPVAWAQPILTGLGGLDSTIATGGWDQTTRASLSALSKDVRARALTVANAAQSARFSVVTLPDGSQADITIDAPGKPWYKSGPVIGAGILGIFGGIAAAMHRRNQ
jgi:hypothetical protein